MEVHVVATAFLFVQLLLESVVPLGELHDHPFPGVAPPALEGDLFAAGGERCDHRDLVDTDLRLFLAVELVGAVEPPESRELGEALLEVLIDKNGPDVVAPRVLPQPSPAVGVKGPYEVGGVVGKRFLYPLDHLLGGVPSEGEAEDSHATGRALAGFLEGAVEPPGEPLGLAAAGRGYDNLAGDVVSDEGCVVAGQVHHGEAVVQRYQKSVTSRCPGSG